MFKQAKHILQNAYMCIYTPGIYVLNTDIHVFTYKYEYILTYSWKWFKQNNFEWQKKKVVTFFCLCA